MIVGDTVPKVMLNCNFFTVMSISIWGIPDLLKIRFDVQDIQASQSWGFLVSPHGEP